MRNFYPFCNFFTLVINFSEVWPSQILLSINVYAVRLRNVFNTSQRRVKKDSLNWSNILKTTFQQNILNMFWRRLEDVWLRRVYSSRWRRLLKTKSKDFFKTASRRFHQDESLLGKQFPGYFFSKNCSWNSINHSILSWINSCLSVIWKVKSL